MAMDTTPMYAIRVRGRLDQRRAAWFDNMSIQHVANGDTILSGPLPDQAALHGVLARVRDLGLNLVAVNEIADETHSMQ
jgi:hypothetical protein